MSRNTSDSPQVDQPALGSVTNPLKVTLFEGDGIGATEGRLIQALEELVTIFRDYFSLHVALKPFDLSLERRLDFTDSDQLAELYRDARNAVKTTAGRAIKLPTVTPTPDQVQKFLIEQNEPEDSTISKEHHALHDGHSPNDALRNELRLNDIVRSFAAGDRLSAGPKPPARLWVSSDETANTFVSEEGRLSRTLDLALTRAAARETLGKAKRIGQKIVVAGKNTISKLDARFLGEIEEVAKKMGLSHLLEKPVLFDTLLAQIFQGKHADALIMCPPDLAEILKDFSERVARQKPKKRSGAESPNVPNRTVHRLPIGTGYGEELTEEGDVVRESFTVNEEKVRILARLAIADAKKNRQPLTVVTLGVNPSKADKQWLKIVQEELESEDLSIKPLSQVLAELCENPADPAHSVYLTCNRGGDFLTDALPMIHYGKLGAAALGAGESLAKSVNEQGQIATVFTDPSTGTAPDLIKNPEKVIPTGILLALCTLLAEDPRLPATIQTIGRTVHGHVLEVLAETHRDESHLSYVNAIADKLSATA